MRWRSLSNGLALSTFLLGARVVFADPAPLLAEVTVNQVPQQTSLLLWDGQDGYFASPTDLARWRIRRPYPAPTVYQDQPYHPLHAIPGAMIRYEPRTVSVILELPPRALQPTLASLAPDGPPTPSAGTGAYLDYDLSYTDTNQSYAAALLAPTLFTPAGALFSEVAYRDADAVFSERDNAEDWVRLSTTFNRDDPDRMRSYRAFDVVSAPSPWGGAYRVAGLQIASNFSTQPEFVTFPVPSLQGEAQVPSTVDLYVNNVLRRREDVQPGEFRLDDVPVVSGAGQVRMVVTDVLGREQVVIQDFYAPDVLLRDGLSEYSFTVGILRRNFGRVSNDYGGGAFVGAYRRGLNAQLTAGGRLELGPDAQLTAGSADWALHQSGVIGGGIGLSNSDDGIGGAWRIGYEFRSPDLRLATRLAGTTSRFAAIDARTGGRPPELELMFTSGWDAGIFGSIGATVVHQSHHERADRDIVTLSGSRRTRSGYSVSAYASYARAEESDYSVGLTFTRSLGHRRSVSAQATQDADDTRLRMETLHSMPAGPGFGYRLGTTLADNTQFDANLMAQANIGRYAVDAQHRDGRLAWQANAAGSVAWLGGRPYLARDISNGFAVVDLGGIENVRIYAENQEIGRSDANGRLLLPRLRPYETNRIRIEAADIPLHARIETLSMEVSTFRRSGTVVEFPIMQDRSVVLHAMLMDGQPVPEGAVVTVAGRDDATVVGLDGKIYLESLPRRSFVLVSWSDQSCVLDVAPPEDDHPLPDLGDVACEIVP
jgi:outer membrane usher protein